MTDPGPDARQPPADEPPRSRLDQFAPGRARRVSRSYSVFVGLAKWTLPVVAFAMLATVALWEEFQPDPEPVALPIPTEAETGTLRMANPRFFATDDAAQPYSIIGRSALQSADAGAVIAIESPEAEMTLADGSWLAMLAHQGVYDRAEHRIDVAGAVSLFRDDGLEVQAESARVDLASQTAWAEEAVRVQSPEVSIEAANFRLEQGGAVIAFGGPATLVIHNRPTLPEPGR